MSGFLSNLFDNFTHSGRGETERYSETETYSSSSYGNNSYGPPAPPQVPYPWRAQWDDRERRYCFVHEQTGEQIWEYDEVIRRTQGGGYSEQQSSTYYDEQRGYGGGGYQTEESQRQSSGGHGMAYGALGAAAGLAGGAALMYEGEKIRK